MEVCFGDDSLDRLEADPTFDGGFSEMVVVDFRRRMQMIRAAPDEQVLYHMRSLRFQKLEGDKQHQYSLRLNDQWQLILEFPDGSMNKTVIVVGIQSYYK